MAEKPNIATFTNPDDVGEFIAKLLDIDNEDTFFDIHVYNEDKLVVLEYSQVPYDGSYGGRFEYIDEDSEIVTNKYLPDGTWLQVHSDSEYEEQLVEFLRKHPNYKMNEWGKWILTEDFDNDNNESTAN